MKFKKLNEEFIEEGYINQYVNMVNYRDPIKQQYADFINDTIWNSLDNIDTLAHSKIDGLPDTVIEADSREFKNEEDAIYNFVKIKTDNYFANTTNESLEANDEDGWGEDVRFALEDMFDSAENIMYEVRNCVRGSYTRVDTVEELADKIRQMCQGFEVVADQLEDESDALQERLNEDRKALASRIRKGQIKHGNSLADNQNDPDEVRDADEYDSQFGFEWDEDDDTQIQFQDRQMNTHFLRKDNNKFEKSPRVSSNTWGRVWKNGNLEKQFEGPKYKVRADMAKYLDTDESLKEEFEIGQKVRYNGKETFIKDIENDATYGIDLLIKNPDWDGKDDRFEYIWVADKVEAI